jgi:two-component system, OmpR family, alkaline phosphatase synthesis response regulator PhoP
MSEYANKPNLNKPFIFPKFFYGMIRSEMEVMPMSNSTSEIQMKPEDVYDDGSLRIEHDAYYVSFNGQVLFLTPKEFLVLSKLSRTIGRMVPSKSLWRYAWGEKESFNSKTLRVHVCNLRRKIAPLGLNIRSMTSLGYCLFWIQKQIRTQP